MLQFNTAGLLEPSKNIISSLDEFEKYFMFNQHREILYQKYLSYLIDLQLVGIEKFTQWIDGSFVTKKIAPNDIDIVTFIPDELYRFYQVQLVELANKYQGLDCYYIREFSVNHPKRIVSDFDKTEWRFLFSTDRKKQAKGFIELNF